MASKMYDVVVKTGEYQSNGETKGRYENIGTMMQGDNGPFLILKRTFNPAGVPNPDNKDSVLVSLFEPQQQQNNQQNNQQGQQQGQQQGGYQQNQQQQPQQNRGGYQQQPPQGGYQGQRG